MITKDQIAVLHEEIERHRSKWWHYEQTHILPCFAIAEEIGFDLKAAVSEHRGENSTMLLIKHLRSEVERLKKEKC